MHLLSPLQPHKPQSHKKETCLSYDSGPGHGEDRRPRSTCSFWGWSCCLAVGRRHVTPAWAHRFLCFCCRMPLCIISVGNCAVHVFASIRRRQKTWCQYNIAPTSAIVGRRNVGDKGITDGCSSLHEEEKVRRMYVAYKRLEKRGQRFFSFPFLFLFLLC